MKYLSIDLSSFTCGITNQIANFSVLAFYCYDNDFILILPKFRLYGFHNNNKEIITNLTDYIDFTTCMINGQKLKYVIDTNDIDTNDILHIESSIYSGCILTNNDRFKNQKNHCITYNYTTEILHIANEISSILGEYLCVHVRRTDMLREHPVLEKDTLPENILKKVNLYNNQKVYIMTNEKTSFFDQLKNQTEKEFYFYSDFDILKQIKEEDNYKLFCIENEISKLSNKRISTFKTPFNGKYVDSLSEQFGWQ